jgi:hypothetical protein
LGERQGDKLSTVKKAIIEWEGEASYRCGEAIRFKALASVSLISGMLSCLLFLARFEQWFGRPIG